MACCFISCSKTKKETVKTVEKEIDHDVEEGEKEKSENKEQKEIAKLSLEQEKITISSEVTPGYMFTVSEKGDIYSLNLDGSLVCNERDGEEKIIIENANDFTSICFSDERLIGYQAVERAFYFIDPETGKLDRIAYGFPASDILRMDVFEDYLYVCMIPLDAIAYADKDNYINMGEEIYRFSLINGEKEKIDIPNILDFTVTSDKRILFYAYQDGAYVVGNLDPLSKETNILFNATEKYGLKYLSSFLIEEGYFFYTELDPPSVVVLRLEDGKEVYHQKDRMVLDGGDVTYQKGNIFYRGYGKTEEENILQSIFVPEL